MTQRSLYEHTQKMGASPLHTCTNRKLNDRQTGARLQPVAVLCVTPTTTQPCCVHMHLISVAPAAGAGGTHV